MLPIPVNTMLRAATRASSLVQLAPDFKGSSSSRQLSMTDTSDLETLLTLKISIANGSTTPQESRSCFSQGYGTEPRMPSSPIRQELSLALDVSRDSDLDHILDRNYC